MSYVTIFSNASWYPRERAGGNAEVHQKGRRLVERPLRERAELYVQLHSHRLLVNSEKMGRIGKFAGASAHRNPELDLFLSNHRQTSERGSGWSNSCRTTPFSPRPLEESEMCAERKISKKPSCGVCFKLRRRRSQDLQQPNGNGN
jgi:hypothetical protein